MKIVKSYMKLLEQFHSEHKFAKARLLQALYKINTLNGQNYVNYNLDG